MPTIFVATTHTARSRARTGIQTVVRGLVSGLSQIAVDFELVRWVPWRRSLLPLKPSGSQRVGAIHAGNSLHRHRFPGSWLLLPEVLYRAKHHRVIRFARKNKMRVAAIMHDAIPVSHP